MVAWLWLIGATLATLRLIAAHRRFHRSIAGREEVPSPGLRSRLLALQTGAGFTRDIRLTTCDALVVPIAFGLQHREICLPKRVVDLGPAEQEALLAHELAHHLRRDPLWLLALNAVEAVFFFQPLHALVRRRCVAASEAAADAWAARTAGDPVALARCLTTVAGWVQSRRAPSLVPAMAGRPSDLRRRIERLMEDGGRSWRPRPIGSVVLAAGLLAAVALFAPGVSLAERDAPVPPAPVEDEAPPQEPQERAPATKAVPPAPPLPPAKRTTKASAGEKEEQAREKDSARREKESRAVHRQQEEIRREMEAVRREAEAVAREAVEVARQEAPRVIEEVRRELETITREVLGDVRRELESAARELARERERLAREHRKLKEETEHLREKRKRLEEEKEGAARP